jgi:putative transposase
MNAQSKREHLRDLVEGKNGAFRALTEQERSLGFLGWHERGYLPHCDFPGLTQLVTFRLVDSMPVTRKGEWEHLLEIEDSREKRAKLEAYLDRGVGECHLRNPRVASLVESAFLHFHGHRYELLAWCVMPNHAHVLVRIDHTPLWQVVQSWKVKTGREANRILDRNGPFWEREYWDTYMRNADQTARAVRYIESNPVKARLCKSPEDWPFGSARFRDLKSETLSLPAAGAASSITT